MKCSRNGHFWGFIFQKTFICMGFSPYLNSMNTAKNTTTTPRNKRRSPNAVFDERLSKFVAKKAKEKEAKEKEIAEKKETKKRRKKRRKKSATQLKISCEKRQAYNENPVEFFKQKYQKENKVALNKKRLKAEREKREEKNPPKFKSLVDYMEHYNDPQVFNDEYYDKTISIRGNEDGIVKCPHCPPDIYTKVYVYRSRPVYKCTRCGHQYRLDTGTILHRMRKPKDRFFLLLFQNLVIKKGLTAEEAGLTIGVSNKTGFLYLNKIRAIAFKQLKEAITGNKVVCIDTTAVFGRNFNRPDWNKLPMEEIYRLSKQVLVIQEPFGNSYAIIVDNLEKETMEQVIKEVVPEGTTIYTDQHASFADIEDIKDEDGNDMNYTHETVNHSAGEHSRGEVTNNPVESKNGDIKGTVDAHGNNLSKEGLQLLLNEIIFKSNCRAQGLSIYEQYNLAEENLIRNGIPQEKAKVIQLRRSVFKKMAIAAAA